MQTKFDGSPAVIFLESLMQSHGFKTRVILPITDPYVVHHGALGSYAGIYITEHRGDDNALLRIMQLLRTVPGVYTVMDRNEACRTLELPTDRTADIVVVGDRSTVFGR